MIRPIYFFDLRVIFYKKSLFVGNRGRLGNESGNRPIILLFNPARDKLGLNHPATTPHEGNHEQRRIFLEKISRYLPGQGKAQSKNWHSLDQIRPRTQIRSDAGLSGTCLGFDNRYGNFCVG